MKVSQTILLLVTALATTQAGDVWRYAGHSYTDGSCTAGQNQVDALGTFTPPITNDNVKSVKIQVRAQIKEDIGCNSHAYIVEANQCSKIPGDKPIHCIQLLKAQ